jgi:transcriptional regulator with XRE-family HTH domain
MATLRELRVRRLLSIRALATQAGVTPLTVQLIEAGRRVPQPKTIRKLSDALGIEPSEVEEFWRAMEGGRNPGKSGRVE